MKNFIKIYLAFTLLLIIIYAIICTYTKFIPINRRLFSNLPNHTQFQTNVNNITSLSYKDKIKIFLSNYVAYIISIFVMILYIHQIRNDFKNNILIQLCVISILIILEIIIEYSYISTTKNQFTGIALILTPFSQTISLILSGLIVALIADNNFYELLKKINIRKYYE